MRRSAIFILIAFFLASPVLAQQNIASATFAGGCFWCMEPPFDGVPGVASTISGYSGGTKKNPTYEEVSSGGTGHAEVVQVKYDPKKVTYQQLLDIFWKNIDPTDPSGQFCDKGSQYRSAIFYHDENQRKLAEQSKAAIEKKIGTKVATEIVPLKEFYSAEEYHQDFYKKNRYRYKAYRIGCGRDRRLEQLWGNTTKTQRREGL